MTNLFLVLFLISLVCLIVGLVNPRIFSRIIKNANRKKLSLIFGLIFVVSFIGGCSTAPPVEPKTPEELVEIALQKEETSQKKENKAKKETKLQDNQVKVIEAETPTKPDNLEQVTIARVIDGDTVVTTDGERIRYIGIDTPETVHPFKDVEFYGKEASDKNKVLVEGKTVELEKDISKKDRYGRTLAYIWLNSEMINATLVSEGYAYTYTYPPDVKYSDYFLMLQKQAQDKKKGLWINYEEQPEFEPDNNNNNELPPPPPSDSPPSTPPPPPSDPPPPKEGIICSSNHYNCSDFSTHAEAQNVFDYCGGVANDIHRLDRDKDGLACESLP